MAFGPQGLFLALAVALCAASLACADTEVLSCNENPTAGTAWSCENFGTVAGKANVTYQLAIQPSDAQYERFDVNITLTSLSGDADLCGPLPGRPFNSPKWQPHAGQHGAARGGAVGEDLAQAWLFIQQWPMQLGAAGCAERSGTHLGS